MLCVLDLAFPGNIKQKMAKVVIAGSADCPYFAKAELLADSLMRNLPDFKLHKIVKQPEEWKNWLNVTCQERGWSHTKSPLVWRELLDRGGKGMLIGGANEFQEYAYGYYGVRSAFTTDDVKKFGAENKQTKIEMDKEDTMFRSQSTPIHVCVTCATDPVCYNMIHAIAKGETLGSNTEIDLHLLDNEENMAALEGVQMETVDLACPLIKKVTVTSNMEEAFTNCSAIVLLDTLTQGTEESRDDWLKRNSEHFVLYAKIINDYARKDVKVILAGNGPVNFNAFMMIQHAPSIPRQNIVAMSRMVENNAKAILAGRLKVNSAGIVDVIVWGNSSGTYFLDVSKARVRGYDGAIWGPPPFSMSVAEMVHDEKWLQGDFLEILKNRNDSLEAGLNHKAAMSHAAAAVTLLQHWWNGSTDGQIFSLGVCSEGLYGVPEGMVFSFPVTFSPKGYWSVVQDINLDEDSTAKVAESIKELTAEKEVMYPPPYKPPPTPPPQQDTPTGDQTNQATADASGGESGTSETGQPTSDSEDGEKNTEGDPDDETAPLGRILEDKEGEEEAALETGVVKNEDVTQEEVPEA